MKKYSCKPNPEMCQVRYTITLPFQFDELCAQILALLNTFTTCTFSATFLAITTLFQLDIYRRTLYNDPKDVFH